VQRGGGGHTSMAKSAERPLPNQCREVRWRAANEWRSEILSEQDLGGGTNCSKARAHHRGPGKPSSLEQCAISANRAKHHGPENQASLKQSELKGAGDRRARGPELPRIHRAVGNAAADLIKGQAVKRIKDRIRSGKPIARARFDRDLVRWVSLGLDRRQDWWLERRSWSRAGCGRAIQPAPVVVGDEARRNGTSAW